jgi:hypothetical protein
MLILLAFLCGLALDLVWTRCVTDVQSQRPFSAANTSVLVYLCTLVSTLLIVDKAVLACVAYAVGSWVGTYVAVRRKR